MKAHRTIYTDNPESIDYSNLGNHFSGNLSYYHRGGGSNGLTPEDSKYMVDVIVDIKPSQINDEATSLSRLEHPKEEEIVTLLNTELKAEIYVHPRTRFGGFGRPSQTVTRVVNTGTRVDQWVQEL